MIQARGRHESSGHSRWRVTSRRIGESAGADGYIGLQSVARNAHIAHKETISLVSSKLFCVYKYCAYYTHIIISSIRTREILESMHNIIVRKFVKLQFVDGRIGVIKISLENSQV